MTTTDPRASRRPVVAALAAGVLLALAAGAALLGSDGIRREVRRLFRESPTDTTIFAQIGRTTAIAADLEGVATPLAAAAVLALLVALALLLLRRARIAGLEPRMLLALPALGTVLVVLGVLGALDYAHRQGLTGTLTDPSTAASVPATYATASTAATAAGLIAVLLWLAIVALRRSPRWSTALWVVVGALALGAVLVLQLRIVGYARMQELYSVFYTAYPDPRATGRAIIALQARDQAMQILGAGALAAAAVGIPLAAGATVLRRVSPR